MRTLFNTTIAFFGAVMLFSACEKNTVNPTPLGPLPQPTVMLSGVGGCESPNEGVLAGSHNDDQLEAVVADSKVTFTHSGATYNCCLDSIGLDIEHEGLLFRVLETEYAPNPCYCICDYMIYGEIVDLTAGDYTIEVINAAEPTKVLCSTTVTVP